MSTHTAGPFTVKGPSRPTSDTPEGGDYAIFDSDGEIIAECFRRVNPHASGIRPARANAKLFAAAPDLLETLRTIVGNAASVQMDPQWAVQVARNAIARATGEAL